MQSTRKKRYKSKYISRDYTSLVNRVLIEYLESLALVQLGNIPSTLAQCDPLAKRPLSLIYRAQYCTDVEAAIRAAVKTTQQEDCLDAMLCEMADSDECTEFSLDLRTVVVQRVGREIKRRRLAPSQYFARRHKG